MILRCSPNEGNCFRDSMLLRDMRKQRCQLSQRTAAEAARLHVVGKLAQARVQVVGDESAATNLECVAAGHDQPPNGFR